MKYQHSYRQRKSKKSRVLPVFGTLVIVLLLGGLFVYSVKAFRDRDDEIDESVPEVSVTDLAGTSISVQLPENDAKEATMVAKTSEGGHGTARRDVKVGKYELTVKVAMPEIDREVHFYEVWLLRQIPYSFFSVGEMVTNDLGEFVLGFEGEEDQDYSEYHRVVITRQVYDGDSDPGRHIVEGEFGK